MREIKFRFFDTEKNYMAYAGPETGLTDGDLLDYGMKAGYPVMQFTGLRDKNGVKIFCGDILDEDGSLFIVVWDDEWAKFKLQYASPKSIQYPEWNRGKKMIIAGNLHQHPHLLDQKK